MRSSFGQGFSALVRWFVSRLANRTCSSLPLLPRILGALLFLFFSNSLLSANYYFSTKSAALAKCYSLETPNPR
ncbi:MAG: hypothetical protein WB402_08210, partial [Sulfuricaulis sp.]|uniref:hypothetical protein n=1 Tax=Sulfuricaulis sp. TaxID=2003553 RepID=UPI003C578E0B